MATPIGTAPTPISPIMVQLLDEIKIYGDNERIALFDTHNPELYINPIVKKLEDLEKKDNFFLNNLITDETFVESPYFKMLDEYLHDLATKYKRSATFYVTLKAYLKMKGLLKKYTASHKYMPEVLNGYMADLAILKKRRGIKKVQFSKIAGLMTNLIIKYRPIVPLNLTDDPYKDINENFAIYHAIAICADYDGGDKAMEAFEKSDYYEPFYKEITRLLKRNFTPESLISVFKTLCLYQFPKALEESDTDEHRT